jgi:hypothetical protein
MISVAVWYNATGTSVVAAVMVKSASGFAMAAVATEPA